MNLEGIIASLKTHKPGLIITSAVLATAAADVYATVQGVSAKGIDYEGNELAKDLMHRFGLVVGASLTKALGLSLVPIGDWLSKKIAGLNYVMSYIMIFNNTIGATAWYFTSYN